MVSNTLHTGKAVQLQWNIYEQTYTYSIIMTILTVLAFCTHSNPANR